MKKFINFILAILTSFSLFVPLDQKDIILRDTNINFLGILLCTVFIYIIYDKYLKKEKISKLKLSLSILLSLFMIIGYSFENSHSFNFVFGNFYFILISLIKLISLTTLFYTIITLLDKFVLKEKKLDSLKNNKLVKKFNKHPFLYSFIIIIICWLPYIISFYPAILSPDPSFQIKQFMGIRTKYSDYAIMLDDSVTITNHHPVFHTVLLGGCVKIGTLLGSANLGLFMYSIMQIIILASTLAYTIKYLTKLKSPNIFKVIMLGMYAFIPVFPLYAMSPVKDVLFGSFILLYIMMLFDLIKNNNYKWWKYLLLIGVMILVTLLRNNGIYTIILSFPFLFLISLKNKKVLLLIFLLVVGSYYSYTKILLPSLKITDGSIREMLSIPFQQTARYVKTYPKEVTKEEQKAIDKILNYDTLAKRYKTNIADPVKNEFNKYATSNDLKKYFIVWLQQLKKHPITYVEATLDNTYGYFYPNTTNWYIYYKYDKRLSLDNIDYHYNKLDFSRNILQNYGLSYPYIPVLGLFVNIGFTTWLYLYLAYLLLKQKKSRYLIVLSVAFSLILVCFASPVNTYFRYALPGIFSLPVTMAMLYSILKKE